MSSYSIKDIHDLDAVANAIVALTAEYNLFCFVGEMGAGKTTLIKKITSLMGVTNQTSSPTYSIVNEYLVGNRKIYHFDFYRIKNIEEAYDMGIEEYLFDSNAICFIEWPERIAELVNKEQRVEVVVNVSIDGSRTIDLIGYN